MQLALEPQLRISLWGDIKFPNNVQLPNNHQIQLPYADQNQLAFHTFFEMCQKYKCRMCEWCESILEEISKLAHRASYHKLFGATDSLSMQSLQYYWNQHP